MLALTALERAVLEMMFAGDHSALIALRAQVSEARIVERELTGVGFFTTFEVPREVSRAPLAKDRVVFGDVRGEIEGLEHGAGFIVSISEGYLECLEGYCHEDAWPEPIRGFRLACGGAAGLAGGADRVMIRSMGAREREERRKAQQARERADAFSRGVMRAGILGLGDELDPELVGLIAKRWSFEMVPGSVAPRFDLVETLGLTPAPQPLPLEYLAYLARHQGGMPARLFAGPRQVDRILHYCIDTPEEEDAFGLGAFYVPHLVARLELPEELCPFAALDSEGMRDFDLVCFDYTDPGPPRIALYGNPNGRRPEWAARPADAHRTTEGAQRLAATFDAFMDSLIQR